MKLSRTWNLGVWLFFRAALAALAALALFAAAVPTVTYAQTQGAANLSNEQLDSLTAPIALYPDALLAQVLMAATFPQDVPAAAAWSKSNPDIKATTP